MSSSPRESRSRPLDAEEATIDLGPGARDSLLFVFTTDCSACRENQASWRTVYETIGGAVDVYGISLSDIEATRTYCETLALSFPVGVLVDPPAFIESLAISGVPLTVRLGGDGRVIGSWSGTLTDLQLAEVIGSEHG